MRILSCNDHHSLVVIKLAYLLCNCNPAKTNILKEEGHVNEVSEVRVPANASVPVRLIDVELDGFCDDVGINGQQDDEG